MIEGLRNSLADLRENEERCRDAALAIQRVLEAEGAMCQEAVAEPTSAAVVKVKALFAGPISTPTLAWPTATAVVDLPATAAQKKPARKAAKTAQEKKPTAKAGGMDSRVCVICGKTYRPKAATQKACSTTCVAEKNRRYAAAKYHAQHAAKQTPATTPKPTQRTAGPSVPTSGQTRVERIKAMSGFVDPIPQRVRDAAAEARESMEVR
jgi:hypothetical protein